jgi:NAD(P)-dependent dehydrogenase (short-subunit alcohol dehydrogenase family)
MLKSSVETELLKDSPQEVLDHPAEMTPLRRLGRPEDIAAAVSFLVVWMVNGSMGKPSA